MLATIKFIILLIGFFLLAHDVILEHWLKFKKLSFRKEVRLFGRRLHHSYVGIIIILAYIFV